MSDIEGYVVLTYKFNREGKRYTAYCEELGTATFGRSLKEAEARLEEAVGLHLNTLEELGERGLVEERRTVDPL